MCESCIPTTATLAAAIEATGTTSTSHLLDYAAAHGLRVCLELDPGHITVTAADAIEIWDELAPGESYELIDLVPVGAPDPHDGTTVQ